MSMLNAALGRLYVLNEALSGATTREAVGAAVRAHASLFRSQTGYLYFLEPSHLILGPHWGLEQASVDLWSVLPTEGDNMMTRAWVAGVPQIVPSARLHQEFPELAAVDPPPDCVYVSLPVGSDDQTLGILGLRLAAEQATDEHVAFLERCAVDIGRALGRAVLHERVLRAAEVEQRVLATLSHDLRTPLGAIGMSAELLKRHPDLPDAPAYLDRILASVDRASRMIDSLLAYSRARQALDRQRMPLIHVDSVVQGQIDELRSLYPHRAINLQIHDEDLSLHAERTGIEQILSNLVRNAIQHGRPDTPVDVVLRRHEGLELSVTNDGDPIPVEVVERLFEAFHTERTTGGVGLGLFIVRELVERLGGRVDVVSDDRIAFIVTIPS